MNFRIIPGMSCWGEMPKKYKEAYFKFINKNKLMSFYEKNQIKIDKEWNNLIKKEKVKENNWINWMEN